MWQKEPCHFWTVAYSMVKVPEWLHKVLDKCPSMAETCTHFTQLIVEVNKLLDQCTWSHVGDPELVNKNNNLFNWAPRMPLFALTNSELRQWLWIYEECNNAMRVPIQFLEERFSHLKASSRTVEIKRPVMIGKHQLLHNAQKEFDAAYNSNLQKSTDASYVNPWLYHIFCLVYSPGIETLKKFWCKGMSLLLEGVDDVIKLVVVPFCSLETAGCKFQVDQFRNILI